MLQRSGCAQPAGVDGPVADLGQQLPDGVLGLLVVAGVEAIERGAVDDRVGLVGGEDGVEGLDDVRAGEPVLDFLRAGALGGRQAGGVGVDRVGGIENDLAGDGVAEFAGDVGERAVGDGQHDHVGVPCRLGRAGRGRSADLGGDRRHLRGIGRAESHGVSGATHAASDRGADMAGTDDGDLHGILLGASGGSDSGRCR